MNLVEPRLSRGLRDLLPEDSLARQAMIDVVRGVYELYGFVPLTTPAVEYLDVLSGSGGQEIQESIFVVRNPEEEELGLRFDHTVPLARVIAQYKDLPKPFRRYTVGPVWRAAVFASSCNSTSTPSASSPKWQIPRSLAVFVTAWRLSEFQTTRFDSPAGAF